MSEKKKEEVIIKEKKKRKAPSTAWKPGQSGNIYGRPKKDQCLTDILRAKLDTEMIIDGNRVLAKDLVVMRLLDLAINQKDLSAIRYILDRTDGTPKQTTEIQGSDENPLNIAINVVKDGPKEIE